MHHFLHRHYGLPRGAVGVCGPFRYGLGEGTLLRIAVCLKQTLDPEVPPRDFRIDPEIRRPQSRAAKLVMDSYGENALAVAIQLKERFGAQVTAITVGDQPADEILRWALALTADRAVRVWEAGWHELDAHALAHVLACTISHLGGADLVLTGREAADVERGHVGSMVSEELGFPCVTLVGRVELDGERLKLRREVESGFELVESRLPVGVTITSDETNVARLPRVKDTLMAMRKPISVLSAGDINVVVERLVPRVRLIDLFIPAVEEQCEFIAADNPVNRAHLLVRRLRERKVL